METGQYHQWGGTNTATGFHNIQPRTRQERGERGPAAEVHHVLTAVPNSSLYIDEHTRFAARDAAAAEYARRQENLHRTELLLERKRAEGYFREEKYHTSNINVHDREEAKLQHKREAGEGGTRRGKSSACYNILTLDYNPTPEGQALQYKDQTTQYKAALRAQNLYNKGHSVGHNIITGAPVWQPQPPARPIPPWER